MKLIDRLRRDRPPADVTAALDPSDRLLSWATTDDGFLVASRRGLRLPNSRFLPWHRIDKAVWRDGSLQLTEAVQVEPMQVEAAQVEAVQVEAAVMQAQDPVEFTLSEPRNLPAIVQTRVTQSVAHTSRHVLPGQTGAIRIVARRVVGQDGLEWTVRYEGGADRSDLLVRQAAEQMLSETRAATTPAE